MGLFDGRILLATAGYQTVWIWDPHTGEAVGEPLTGHTGWIRAITTLDLSDGRILLATAGDDQTVRIWDPHTGEAMGQPLIGHTDGIRAITTISLPGGRTLLATAGDDRTVRLWDPIQRRELAGFALPAPAEALASLAHHRLAVATGDHIAVLQINVDALTASPAPAPG